MSESIFFLQCFAGPPEGECGGLEGAWIHAEGMRAQEEQDEAIRESDEADRLMCDVCQGYETERAELTRSGGELWCAECVGAMTGQAEPKSGRVEVGHA